MGCFPCSGESSSSKKQERKRKNNSSDNRNRRDDREKTQADTLKVSPPKFVKEDHVVVNQSAAEVASRQSDADKVPCDGDARTFKFIELVDATQNFKPENFLGAGGFGKVYKGQLPDTGEIVAVKQLDHNGCQGVREFLIEVLTLNMAKHPNLVKLIGYCAEGDQRLLVYEYMSLGSLEDHLYGMSLSADPRPNRKTLDWNTRMQIAAGAARGLEYLHDQMSKPIIYRDLKCSNILLGEGYHTKLSDFGLAKVGPSGDETHIITGRRAIDNRRTGSEINLVAWARPLFKDRKKFHQMADPALEGRYPVRGLYQALAIAAMCAQEQPNMRPLIADIVTALNYLASQKYDPNIDPNHCPNTKSKRDGEQKRGMGKDNERTKLED
ncbi:hypothetical protein DH2020_000005 [Rehmannia glutinosa]|uniref:Protein kinase domain-containing protein n=1 Tax=Rehmannia glutinosa TaxID=99300 RepID=A0ABR0W3H3_REHGL